MSQPFQALVGCVSTFAAQCFPAGRGKEANPCTHPPLATLLAYLYLLYNLHTRLFFFFFFAAQRTLPPSAPQLHSFSLCSSLFSLRVCSVDFQSLACFLNPVEKKPSAGLLGGVFLFCFSQWRAGVRGGGGRCSCSKSPTCNFLQPAEPTLRRASSFGVRKEQKKKKKKKTSKATSLACLQMVCC